MPVTPVTGIGRISPHIILRAAAEALELRDPRIRRPYVSNEFCISLTSAGRRSHNVSVKSARVLLPDGALANSLS